MIIKQVPSLHIQKITDLLNKGGGIPFLLLLFGIAFYLLFFGEDKSLVLEDKQGEVISTEKRQELSYERIGAGPFSFSPGLKGFFLADLKCEFLLLGKNTRPDASLSDVIIHLALRGTDEQIQVVPGQTLYLVFTENHRLKFERTPTPLWMKASLKEGGEIGIELGLRCIGERGEKLLEERSDFILEQSGMSDFEGSFSFQETLRAFEPAKWWGADRLFEVYGGKDYESLQAHQRIEWVFGKEHLILHVKQGDYCVFEEGRFWKRALGEETKHRPLLWVRMVTPYKIEWDVWDETGLKKKVVRQTREQPPSFSLQGKDLFSQIRQRTMSQVSCRINHHSMLLKQGDWLLKTQSKWRVLKSLREIEEVLEFKTQGILFVFDGLQKKQGEWLFSGTLFNPMRTQMHHVCLPLHQQEDSRHSPHTKKRVSTKIQGTSPLP